MYVVKMWRDSDGRFIGIGWYATFGIFSVGLFLYEAKDNMEYKAKQNEKINKQIKKNQQQTNKEKHPNSQTNNNIWSIIYRMIII